LKILKPVLLLLLSVRKSYLWHGCETALGSKFLSSDCLQNYRPPDSEQVKTLALTNTDEGIIWEYAKANDFVIVSKDSDFHQGSLLYGHPPKFIYLRIDNSPTSKIVQILRDNFDTIIQFGDRELESILVLA
jgi:predicted nuclease of predicted toxin-antitoxin system